MRRIFRSLLALVSLSLVLSPATLMAQAALEWHSIILPANRASVDDPAGLIMAVNRAMSSQAVTENQASLQIVNDLIASKPLPFSGTELLGSWRCRSIQGGPLGIYIYPYFACQIERRANRLYLSKTSGSQFRRGFFYPDGENNRRIFLGVQYALSDKPTTYSGLLPKEEMTPETAKFDSAGVLIKKDKGHFFLMLDASGKSYEIYDFAR